MYRIIKKEIPYFELIEDKSQDKNMRICLLTMFIEPVKTYSEALFWKERLDFQGIPYVLGKVECTINSFDEDRDGAKFTKGYCLFIWMDE